MGKKKEKTKRKKKKERTAQCFTVDLHSETLSSFSFFLIAKIGQILWFPSKNGFFLIHVSVLMIVFQYYFTRKYIK
jgi:hypothetical protein